MKIKATLENRVKIQDALDSVNGRATQHVLRFASDVFAALDQAEARLAALSKAERSGAEMSYSPAGPWSKSYKYAAKGTRFCALRGVKHWYLSCLETTDLYPCQKERLVVKITAAQAQRIADVTLSAFVVTKQESEVAA
jgi:hypothetical protein